MVNKLIYPVRVLINGRYQLTIPASATTPIALSHPPATVHVAFVMERPDIEGRPLGEAIAAEFPAITHPRGTHDFLITNRIGDQWYFAPLMTNAGSDELLLEVNGGLIGQNRCDCLAPRASSNVQFGYYRFFTNSNVRAYHANGNYAGHHDVAWEDFSSHVEAQTGVVRLGLH